MRNTFIINTLSIPGDRITIRGSHNYYFINPRGSHNYGISFEEATTVFADENARLKHDPDHSQGEDRFIFIGFSSKLHLLVVVHAYREADKEIRIISARKATKTERKQYGEFL